MVNERGSGGVSTSDEAAEIELAIGPASASGSFKVEVLHSPAGEMSAVVELNVGALIARTSEIQAALRDGSSSARPSPETERPIREVGRELFTALLGAGDVAGCYRASVALAAERGRRLRLSLRLGSPELASLPWEAMYDPTAGRYVCRHEQVVRNIPVPRVPAPLTVSPPLRILGLISAPSGLPELDAAHERDLLTNALAGPALDGLVEVSWAPTATWDDLHGLLTNGEWHVLHFIGHGGFDASIDQGFLALTRPDGTPHLVMANQFADLLGQAQPMPRLVVLNSCSGAATGTTDLFAGTAGALTRAGVSAVAAMQFEITDTSAAAFARGFYTEIANGGGIDGAISAGRITILGTSSGMLEWLTPVLYLRGNQTHLFTRTAQAPHIPEIAISAQGPWPLLINELVSHLDLDHWDHHVGGLLRPSLWMRSSSRDRLLRLTIWLNGRILPDGQPELKRVLATLQKVMIDLLNEFDLHSEVVGPEQDDPWLRTAQFYKTYGSHADRTATAEDYGVHINLLSDLALELTRAANWLCDVVQREFDPMFRFQQGALQLNGGPYPDADYRWLRPEYSPDDMSSQILPYESLEDFKTRRFSRDYHT